MPSVFMATPTTRQFEGDYVASLWRTQLTGNMHWEYVHGRPIDDARNILTAKFMASGMDYLLMHDSDATWPPEAVQRLVDWDKPIVTAVIFKRGFPTYPTIGVRDRMGKESHVLYGFKACTQWVVDKLNDYSVQFSPETRNELILPKEESDLHEIDACGMHFCLIRRDVIEKIYKSGKPWFEDFSRSGGGRNSGEDFDFCEKAQKAGFTLYADVGVYTGHHYNGYIGVRDFTLHAEEFLKEPDEA